MVVNHLNEDRARDELIHLAYQLLADFPSETPPGEWSRCQVIVGLERIYDQMAASKIPSDDEMNRIT